MAKEEIIGGLRAALSKGDSLQKAMMSFFNAGYPKEDIEEAARYLNSPQLSGQPSAPTQPFAQTPTPQAQPAPPQIPQIQSDLPQTPTPQVQPTPFQNPQTPPTSPPLTSGTYPLLTSQQSSSSEVVQRVSGYGEKKKSSGKTATIVLVVVLLILIGILVSVFLFKDKLAEFFNSLF